MVELGSKMLRYMLCESGGYSTRGQSPDADAHGRGRAVVAAGVERDARDLELGEEQPPFALVGDEGEGGALVGVRRRDVLDLQAGEVIQALESIETVASGIVERAGDIISFCGSVRKFLHC